MNIYIYLFIYLIYLYTYYIYMLTPPPMPTFFPLFHWMFHCNVNHLPSPFATHKTKTKKKVNLFGKCETQKKKQHKKQRIWESNPSLPNPSQPQSRSPKLVLFFVILLFFVFCFFFLGPPKPKVGLLPPFSPNPKVGLLKLCTFISFK
jgi:hypothetical protein